MRRICGNIGSPVLGDHNTGNTGTSIVDNTGSIVDNTGIKNYSSIVIFLQKKIQ